MSRLGVKLTKPHVFLVALFGVLCIRPAIAGAGSAMQPVSEVERWLKDRWCSGQGCIPDEDGYISFRIEHHAEVPLEEVQRLLHKIAKLPDHPKRSWAQRQLARHEDGPEVAIAEFWRSGGSWRYNQTNWQSDGTEWLWVDRVSTPDVTWSLSARDLHIADPSRPPTGKGDWYRNPEIALELLATACVNLLHGRLGTQVPESTEPDISVVEDEQGWIARVRRNAGFEWRFRIEPSESGEPFKIRSMESYRTDDEGTVQTGRVVLSEEMVDTPWGAAHRTAEWINDKGMMWRRYVLLAASDELPNNVESYFKLPAVDGEDPIRGKITVSRIFDYRPGHRRLTQIEKGIATASRPLRGAPSSGLGIRVVGWIAAGVIAAILVYLRLRRKATQ